MGRRHNPPLSALLWEFDIFPLERDLAVAAWELGWVTPHNDWIIRLATQLSAGEARKEGKRRKCGKWHGEGAKPQIVRNVVNTSLPSSSVFTLRKISFAGRGMPAEI